MWKCPSLSFFSISLKIKRSKSNVLVWNASICDSRMTLKIGWIQTCDKLLPLQFYGYPFRYFFVIDFNDHVRCVRGRAVHKYIWSEKDSESFKRIKVLNKWSTGKKSRKIKIELNERKIHKNIKVTRFSWSQSGTPF